MTLLPLLLLVLSSFPAAARKKPVTLDVVTAAPPSAPGAPLWSPDSLRFVYKKDGALRLFELNGRKDRELVRIRDLEQSARPPKEETASRWVNRGVKEREVQWFPDGRRLLVFVRRDLFILDTSSGKWEPALATGEAEYDPQLAPDGARVSFRRAHDLYVLDLVTKRVDRLTADGSAERRNAELDWVYPEELQIGTAHWWSPDSSRIAYLQFDVSGLMTYPHADLLSLRPVAEPQRFPMAGTPNSVVRLGVVRARGGKTRWLDPAGEKDALLARVSWTPDGKDVIVHQLTRVQNRLRLLRLDAGAGGRRTLIEESDPAWINLKDDWKMLADSKSLIWGSERSGYRHLYLVPAGAGTPVPITAGEWEVTELACVDEKARAVYYVSNEGSPLERHLYRAGFDGSNKQRLTRERGTHTAVMSPDCGHFVHTHSSLNEPPRRTVRRASGEEVAVLAERDTALLRDFEILPNELIEFRGKDGTLFYARLIRPSGFDPSRRYPAIVQVYGGPHAQTVRDQWRGADFDQLLAHRGFAVWQMDNRGSAGRGHAWESVVRGRFGRQELADQLEGVERLVSSGFVDRGRIAIQGWSYGGYMTLYSLLHAPDVFRAGVSGAPVTDWRQYDTIYTERYMGLPAENETGYRESSPITHAARLEGKLLLVHNFEDDNVLFAHTLRMMDALQRAGKQYEFLLYPQKSHGVDGPARKHMLEAILGFFERSLRGGP